MPKCTKTEIRKGMQNVLVKRGRETYYTCRPTAKLIKGRSAYKDEPGYACRGPYGPPYGPVKDNNYATLFNRISRNIRVDQKDALCFSRQARNLFNIMKRNLGAVRMSVARTKRKIGMKNMKAYCRVLSTYQREIQTVRPSRSKYC